MDKSYDNKDVYNMTDKQKELVNAIEGLGKKLLGDKFEDFKTFMNRDAIIIQVSREKTSITFKEISKNEILDIMLPKILVHILNFYEPNDRAKIILDVLNNCKDGKEELCIDEED